MSNLHISLTWAPGVGVINPKSIARGWGQDPVPKEEQILYMSEDITVFNHGDCIFIYTIDYKIIIHDTLGLSVFKKHSYDELLNLKTSRQESLGMFFKNIDNIFNWETDPIEINNKIKDLLLID